MLPTPNRYIPGMVLRVFVLFVGALVFLVHNDDAKILNRGENGRTRADNDIGITAVNFAPLIVLLSR
ncbi:hypothetical protein SDC9_150250 [bioreactor metagenome]|uniref:Uncharacterized protein n=1 Tax=bioreactor metagenome TaxID=1076179 RepID=A0A645EMJ9_9ZZZZ